MSDRPSNAEDVSKRIPLEKLRGTEEFQRLTPKQKLFVETYIQCGIDTGTYDSVAATMTAYKCKSMEIARVMSYALVSNLRIVAILNLHFAREPLSSFLETLDRAIKNKKLSIAQFKAMQLKAQIMGFASRLPGATDEATGVIPPDVIAREKEERKSKQKPRASRKSVAEPPSEFDRTSKL